MTSANLQEWIEHPEKLDRDTLYELRNMLARYPYFQTLRLLYLKNLYILHDISFGTELRKSVLYAADRQKLFYLIEAGNFTIQPRKENIAAEEAVEEEPSVDRTLALIDAFLANAPEEITNQMGLLDYSTDYTAYLLQDEAAGEVAEPHHRLKGYELIDHFIENSEKDALLPMRGGTDNSSAGLSRNDSEPSADPEYDVTVHEKEIKSGNENVAVHKEVSTCAESIQDDRVEKEDEDDSCFTETLAKIYIKQQRYSKALEIIKKLSLKYPKKNAYFADQIRFLEKLIINANSK